jgi:ADP-ribose pyrophosphatase
MSDKKFEILNRDALFQGYYRVDRFNLRHERFDGAWTDSFTREVFNRGGRVAAVLPFDPKTDRVVLTEQFRAGVMAAGEYPWITESVAGVIDGNDSPEKTARREAMEEAGCHIYELQKIAEYFVSPGCTSEHITLFIGRTAAPETGSLHGLAAENEDIRVQVMDAAKAISLLYTNKIRDAMTLISLQWFAMHHTELRSRWLVSDVGTPII